MPIGRSKRTYLNVKEGREPAATSPTGWTVDGDLNPAGCPFRSNSLLLYGRGSELEPPSSVSLSVGVGTLLDRVGDIGAGHQFCDPRRTSQPLTMPKCKRVGWLELVESVGQRSTGIRAACAPSLNAVRTMRIEQLKLCAVLAWEVCVVGAGTCGAPPHPTLATSQRHFFMEGAVIRRENSLRHFLHRVGCHEAECLLKGHTPTTSGPRFGNPLRQSSCVPSVASSCRRRLRPCSGTGTRSLPAHPAASWEAR